MAFCRAAKLRLAVLSVLPTCYQLPVTGDDSSASCPFLAADGVTFWFSSTRPGGQGREDLWFCRRSSLNEPFGEPENAGPNVNSDDNEAAPFLTADGLTLFFGRGTPGRGKVRLIYQATRDSIDEPFDEPRKLESIPQGKFSNFPRLSSDGLAMVLITESSDGEYGICLARRRSVSDAFDPPVSLGREFNSFPVSGIALSSDDRTLYFASNRRGSLGSFDLWSTTRVAKQSPDGGKPAEDRATAPPGDGPFALKFDGEDDWVDTGRIPFDSAKPFTIEAQVWLASDRGGSTVMSLSQQGTVKLMATDGAWEVAISDNRNGDIFTFPDSVATGHWQHVALVHDSGEVTLYVNGRSCQRKRLGRFGLSKDPEWRGALGTHLGVGVSNGLHGRLAEVRVSGSVRYDDNFTPPTPTERFADDNDTLALYHFDEGQGDRLEDASGNDHHGTIASARWINLE